MKIVTAVTGIFLSLLLAGMVQAADTSRAMKEDSQHVRDWNLFAKKLYQLHLKRIKTHDIKTTSKVGGYMHRPDYYIQEDFVDKKTGKLLSRILWQKDAGAKNEDTVHVIQLFFYDKKGRVTRDYSAAFLPGARNAPNQTLATLHHYSNGLHGFRTFDASGETIYENCEGTYKGEKVFISLEDYEIYEMRRDNTGMSKDPAYPECFGDLPENGEVFLKKYLRAR
jgi:hypothetical protein